MCATINQKRAVKSLAEKVQKGEKVVIGEVLKDGGYSKSMQEHPNKVTQSKGWNELLNKMLPDDLLTKVHLEGLSAKRGKSPDYLVRHKYLETAYKVKNKFSNNEGGIQNNIFIGIKNAQDKYGEE